MNDPKPISSDLLASYLAGEADTAQREVVQDWAAASPENARELERMRTLWDLGAEATAMPGVDVDAAWGRVEARIAEAEGRGRVRPIGSGTNWVRWMSAAAVVAGLVFAARWSFRPKVEQYVAVGTAAEVVLADNSRSVLAPGSSMDVRMGKVRNVRLTGAAYFDVQRDEGRPFVVEGGDVSVTVLGTSFEVDAHDTSEVVLVRVRSGRVRVVAGTDTVVLQAGTHAVYHKERHFLERKAAPPAEVWGLRILQFEGATLDQVAVQLERIYKVRIGLRNESIAACRLTAEFDDETIAVILSVIAETFGLEVEERNGDYLIDGDGC